MAEARRGGLSGLRVALLEARMSQELAELVRRSGGEPICVPAVREVRREAGPELAALVDRLAAAPPAAPPVIFVLQTGAGVKALFDEAQRIGRIGELLAAMQAGTLVCRGPKPIAALSTRRLTPSVRVREPWTTAELLEALAALPLSGRPCLVVHYGERNDELCEALAARGARLDELLLYEWKLPEDTAPLRALVEEIVAGRVGAVAFTSKVQVRHLFVVAVQAGKLAALQQAMRGRVLVGAVGPTCARALDEVGVPPDLVPEHPKMGAMLQALSERAAGAAQSG